jgi:hypothetical protein
MEDAASLDKEVARVCRAYLDGMAWVYRWVGRRLGTAAACCIAATCADC